MVVLSSILGYLNDVDATEWVSGFRKSATSLATGTFYRVDLCEICYDGVCD